MDEVAIRHIRDSGVVGAGGAGFPTHVKLSASAEIVIANGAECEPLLECDRYLMLQRPYDLIDGIRKAMTIVGANKGYIAVKKKHDDILALYEPILAKIPDMDLAPLPDVYPMGDEQVMVYQVTGRLVPPGGLPLAVGCVVSNVTTMVNVKEALDDDKPVTSRFVTVTGCVKEPYTRDIAIGTPVRDLIEAAGGLTRPDAVLIAGGPMTGRIFGLDDVITKTIGGILALPPESYIVKEKQMTIEAIKLQSRAACFQCRDCTRVCPRWQLGYPFQPHLIMRAANYQVEMAEEVLKTAHYCCDCGLCSTIGCQTMKLSPRMMCNHYKGEVDRPPKFTGPVIPPEIILQDQLVPSKRITMRHLLSQFGHTHFVDGCLTPKEALIPLRQHIGAPAVAAVKAGQSVQKGTIIGTIPDKALGATVHSSIDGTVVSVTDGVVTIKA